MISYSVIIASAARAEIADEFDYLTAEASPTVAMRWLEELEALLASLEHMPERFPLARENPHFPEGTLRRALHHRHRILFTIEAATVRVLHLRHAMREDLTDI